MDKIQIFFQQFNDWAVKEQNVIGAILVGSLARNAAKKSSDIDLMIVVRDPKVYLDDNSWINQFGQVKVNGTKDEDWGLVKTKRVFYENDIEAEFNFSTKEWVETNPVDPGTKKVLTDGNKILVDKDGSLRQLVNSI